MTFEQRFAEFVQSNPSLAAPETATITMTLKQFKAAAKRFWRSGQESAETQVPQTEHVSFFEAIFGKNYHN